MNNRRIFLLITFCMTLLLAACSGSEESTAQKTAKESHKISGEIIAGLRHVPFDSFEEEQNFRVYRGDYIVPEITKGRTLHLISPELNLDKVYPVAEGEKTYFKVPATGVYAYTAGKIHGVIEAVEYTAATYREISALDAVELIKNRNPLILDVRTEREFNSGHIENAKLIPVGVFKTRIDEIEINKEDPVFLYCRSGNRSTVASRMLINAGFKQVINLRHGTNDWNRQRLPLVR